MDFRFAKPHVSERENANLLTFVESLKPSEVEPDGIQQVFALVGHAVAGGYDVPKEIRPWVEALPRGVVILARISAQAVICNANWIMAKRVEEAIYCLVGYVWLYKETP